MAKSSRVFESDVSQSIVRNLKPCPFCGAIPDVSRSSIVKQEWVVSCLKCGSVVMKGNRIPALIKQWNQRYYTVNISQEDINGLIELFNQFRANCCAWDSQILEVKSDVESVLSRLRELSNE